MGSHGAALEASHDVEGGIEIAIQKSATLGGTTPSQSPDFLISSHDWTHFVIATMANLCCIVLIDHDNGKVLGTAF